MLLVVDVGNSNTTLGVFKEDHLQSHWRLTTDRSRTIDEFGTLCRTLFSIEGIPKTSIQAIAISSVVPPLNPTLRGMAKKYFAVDPLFIEPELDTGMPILYHPPQDVGADRVVNGVAAFECYGGPVIVVDFGTATTFDAISEQGEYLGGVITPGVIISAEALFLRAARLPRVEIRKPPRVIGNSTVTSIQSGLYYGNLALVEGILKRMRQELTDSHVVATGGLAKLIGDHTETIEYVNENLTLEGLRLIYKRCGG